MANATAYNKELSHKVRKLTLSIIVDVLEGNKDYGKEFKKSLILKLAGTVLPRLNEHTGEDGLPLQLKVERYDEDADKDNKAT